MKPATVTSYLTEAMVRAMIESQLLPKGALQLICGSAGDLLSHLGLQDAVAFTGSAATGRMLKESPAIVANAVRFNMEADSLNCSILGPDAAPGTEEFDLFVKEVVREMTVKAGQKCTAIRRTIVPAGTEEAVIKAIAKRLEGITIGDPAVEGVRMGPLASRAQVRDEGRRAPQDPRGAAELVLRRIRDDFDVIGADREKGAFFAPMLCSRATSRSRQRAARRRGVRPGEHRDAVRDDRRRDRARQAGARQPLRLALHRRSKVARQVVLGVAPYHGRIMVLDRTSAKESTGHGSPLPNLVHGGPGRAGGGEETGRHARRAPLHAAHRAAGFADDAHRHRSRVHAGRRAEDRRPPSVPEVLRGARDRRHADHRHAARSRSRTSSDSPS